MSSARGIGTRLAVSVLVLGGCAARAPAPPPTPGVIHVPAGWFGRLRAPSPEITAAGDATPGGAATEDPAPASSPLLAPTAPTVLALDSTEPRSAPIRNGLFSPIPGGVFAGYVGDTGLDIASPPRPVYALAAGTLDYAEVGHTRWRGPKDTPFSVRLALDAPIPWQSRHVTHVYYTHLSAVAVDQPEGSLPRHHVEGGERVGTSGVANGLPHLHVGLLLDGDVEQDSWDGLLVESDVRAVLGGYANGDVLPK